MSLLKKFDWVAGSWLSNAVFFAAGCVFFVKGLSSGRHSATIQLYMAISVLLIVLSTVNVLVSRGFIRDFAATVIILASSFVIPFSLDSYGLDLNYVAFAGMVYAIISIAIAPKHVGAGVLAASIAFACYLHYDRAVFRKLPLFDGQLAEMERRLVSEGVSPIDDGSAKIYTVAKPMTLKAVSSLKDIYGDPKKWEYLYKANKSRIDGPDVEIVPGTTLIIPALPQLPVRDFLTLAACYLGGAVMAFCWRLLVSKMYELYILAMSNSSKTVQRQMDEVKAQVETGRNEMRLLKEEMALQIIEMNRITGFKK